MRIKKFFEQKDKLEISNDAVQEIIEKLTNISTDLDDKKKIIVSSLNTLSNFKSKSKKANTQVDDSCLNLETADQKLSDVLGLLDQVVKALNDYNQSGERYLY